MPCYRPWPYKRFAGRSGMDVYCGRSFYFGRFAGLGRSRYHRAVLCPARQQFLIACAPVKCLPFCIRRGRRFFICLNLVSYVMNNKKAGASDTELAKKEGSRKGLRQQSFLGRGGAVERAHRRLFRKEQKKPAQAIRNLQKKISPQKKFVLQTFSAEKRSDGVSERRFFIK